VILEMTASALLSLSTVPTRGSSETAKYLDAQFDEGRRRLRSTYSLGLGITSAGDDLLCVAQECSVSNWDGYGAAPVTDDAYLEARAFLNALPLGTTVPSIGAEPDGHLTFEWHHSPRRTLSVSISPEGDLHYAALIGPSKLYGTEPFLGEVPQIVLDLIHRIGPKTITPSTPIAV